jgi:serine/threonine-protein kinase SRPK3
MINFVEPLPQEWQSQWAKIRLDAGKKDILTNDSNSLAESKLDSRFRELCQEPSLKILLTVIKGLTRFVPSNRISAAEALSMLRDNPCRPECTNV